MDEEPELWEPLVRHLSVHPGYYHIFEEYTSQLFYKDSPLPLPQRHYIAIMAAARHQCQYLMDIHKKEFIRLGGNDEWLKGIDKASTKISQLDVINRLLAHQPWLVQASHLEALSRRPSPDNWSMSELMHGAIILSHIHSLCSFIRGCGIIASQPPSPCMNSSSAGGDEKGGNVQIPRGPKNAGVDKLMARMQELSQSSSQKSQEDKAKLFADLNLESCKLAPGLVSSEFTMVEAEKDDASRFTRECSFEYTDFIKRGANGRTSSGTNCAPTFKIHDYSWEDQGFSTVSQLYSQLSDLLDEKFRLTQSLTYYTMGLHEGVDTTPYRTAIWNYIQSIYGIRHDDYDYQEVNQLVDRPLKTFIKTVCCYPERTTESQRNSVMPGFLKSDKIHVMLLILEAKHQSELLYFLRSVGRFMT